MKYFAVAGLAAVAAAIPDGWETYKPVDPKPTTWSAVPVVPITKTTSSWNTWSTPVVPKPETWKNVPEPPKPETWLPYPSPKKGDDVWEEWNKKPVWTTTVVTAITTYCPEPTKFVHAGKTWDVTKATTITITECPCTISVPVYTKISTSCADKVAASSYEWASAVKPMPESKTPAADEWKNVASTKKVDAASTWAGYPVPSGTEWNNVKVSNTAWAPVAKYTGAANKVNAGAAGLVGVIGAAALLL